MLGLAIVDPNERIRDFCSQTGLEFSLIRAELPELVDAAALDGDGLPPVNFFIT